MVFDFTSVLALVVFICCYAAIVLEHNFKVSKSASALLAGALIWILAGIRNSEHLQETLVEAGNEVFSILIFLLAAMSLVEILIHYKFFDYIRAKLYKYTLNDKKLFWILTGLAFILSGIVDNLTCTIILIQISRKFFKGENLLITAAGIVIAANAGGAFSPIGDVTTIMLWFAKKFSALEILWKGFLPSFGLYLTATALLARRIVDAPTPEAKADELSISLSRSEVGVITLVFLSFLLPITMNFFGLPPYFGLLLGLGLIWALVDSLKKYLTHRTHLEASIEEFIKKTDIPSLKFFVGILLAVSGLHALGVLDYLAHLVYGADPSAGKLIIGNVGLGLLSSILDNVPLTAMAIQVLHTTQSSLWVLLALTVGTGGSLLIIGSAAGVIAMGMVKELNFGKYLKLAFAPALCGYAVGIGIWSFQYFVLHW